MDMIREILEKSEDFAIRKNDRNLHAEKQGVLFANTPEGTEAWVISIFGVVRWSNLGFLDFPENAPFFSYARREWIGNNTKYKRIEDLRSLFYESIPDPFEMLPVPVANYNNRIAHLYGDRSAAARLEKSRTIIRSNPGLTFEGDVLVRYSEATKTFSNKAISGVMSRDSKINEGFVDGRLYRAVITGRNTSGFEFNIQDMYFKGVEILIHEVVGTYYPKTEKEVIDASNYYSNRVEPKHPRVIRYAYPVMPENGYSFSPIHIDTAAMFYIFSMMEGFDFAEMFVDPKSRLLPVYFKTVPIDASNPVIETLISPINPAVRGYTK